MATKTIITHTCDRHPDRSAHATLMFQWSATRQPSQVDMCSECFELTGAYLGPVARPLHEKTRKLAARPTSDTQAIRRWAETNGFSLSTRGRIPQVVEKAYAEATSR